MSVTHSLSITWLLFIVTALFINIYETILFFFPLSFLEVKCLFCCRTNGFYHQVHTVLVFNASIEISICVPMVIWVININIQDKSSYFLDIIYLWNHSRQNYIYFWIYYFPLYLISVSSFSASGLLNLTSAQNIFCLWFFGKESSESFHLCVSMKILIIIMHLFNKKYVAEMSFGDLLRFLTFLGKVLS